MGVDQREYLSNLFDAEHGWQLLLARRPDELERGPRPVEGVFEEELDPHRAMVVAAREYFLTFFM
jgi:hypothetical protein